MLGLKQQQQQLQTQTAQAYQATQSATERQALAQIPWKSFQNDDGSFDMDKVSDAALSVAPTTGQEFVDRFANMTADSANVKKAYYSLSQDYQNTIRSTVGSWAGDPNSSIADLASQADLLKENSPPSSRAAVTKLVNHTLNMISAPNLADGSPKTLAQQKQAGLLFSRAGLSSGEVGGPGGISTPATGTAVGPSGQLVGTTQSRQTGAVQPAGGGAVSLGLSPQQLAQTITLPNGQVTTLGAFLGQSLGGGGKAPAAPQTPPAAPPNKLQPIQRPPPNAPKMDQDRYAAQVQAATDEFQRTSQVANDPMNGVQATRFRNQSILDLIPHAETGPGLRLLNTIASRLPGASGDAYQDLEHYTAQNSAALAKTMGVPGTNLGAETAAAAAGNVERNPGALAEITKTNDALNTGLDLYNRGLAVTSNNGSDPSRVAAYKQAFGKNFDVNAVRWADAHRRGDVAEQQAIQTKLGPNFPLAMQHLKVLKSLAENGDLP